MPGKKKSEDSGGYGCLIVGLLIIITTLLFFQTLFSNLTAFSTVAQFGIKQYGLNIIHLHKTFDCKAKQNLRLYDSVYQVRELKNHKPVIIPAGKNFQLRGYKSKDYVIWIASTVFYKNKRLDGYIYIPKQINVPTFLSALDALLKIFDSNEERDYQIDNDYFVELSDQEKAVYKDTAYESFRDSISKKFNISKVTGSENIQKIAESETLAIIPYISDSEDIKYYCTKEDLIKIDDLYDLYLGGKHEVLFAQISSQYLPEKDGVYQKETYLKILDNIFFRILFFPVFFLIVLPLVFRVLFGKEESIAEESQPVSTTKLIEDIVVLLFFTGAQDGDISASEQTAVAFKLAAWCKKFNTDPEGIYSRATNKFSSMIENQDTENKLNEVSALMGNIKNSLTNDDLKQLIVDMQYIGKSDGSLTEEEKSFISSSHEFFFD